MQDWTVPSMGDKVHTFPGAALMILGEPVLQAHSCPACLAAVCVDARELLLTPWHRALELSVHFGIVAGVTTLQSGHIG